jgi:hypothetical protein
VMRIVAERGRSSEAVAVNRCCQRQPTAALPIRLAAVTRRQPRPWLRRLRRRR